LFCVTERCFNKNEILPFGFAQDRLCFAPQNDRVRRTHQIMLDKVLGFDDELVGEYLLDVRLCVYEPQFAHKALRSFPGRRIGAAEVIGAP